MTEEPHLVPVLNSRSAMYECSVCGVRGFKVEWGTRWTKPHLEHVQCPHCPRKITKRGLARHVLRMHREPNPVMAVRKVIHDGKRIGRNCWVWCPGCDSAHAISVVGEDGSMPEGPCWEWDGNVERPTFSPSLLCTSAYTDPDTKQEVEISRCHSFIQNGQWNFLGDCKHSLRGLHDMVPLPDWLVR